MKQFRLSSVIWLILIVAFGLAFHVQRKARIAIEKEYSSIKSPFLKISYPPVGARWAEYTSQTISAHLVLPLHLETLKAPSARFQFLLADGTESASYRDESFTQESTRVYRTYTNFRNQPNLPQWNGLPIGTHYIRVDVFDGDKSIATAFTQIHVVEHPGKKSTTTPPQQAQP